MAIKELWEEHIRLLHFFMNSSTLLFYINGSKNKNNLFQVCSVVESGRTINRTTLF